MLAPRQLMLILAAVFLDALAYAMLIPLTPAFGVEVGFGQSGAGLILGVYAIGLFAAVLPLALFGNACPGRPLLTFGVVLLISSLLIYPLADNFALLLLARLLQGAASGILWTAGLVLLAEDPQPQRRGRNMGLVVSSFSAGLTLGPPAAGLLATLGPNHAFYLPVALCVALLWMLRHQHRPTKTAATSSGNSVPLLALLRDPTCRLYGLAVATTAFAMGFLEPVLPPWLADTHGVGTLGSGLLFGLLALSLALATPLAGARLATIEPVSLLRRGFLALALLTAGLIILPIALIVILVIGFGLLCGLLLAPTMPGLATRVERLGGRNYAVIFALFNLSFASGLAAGPLLGGAIAERLGGPASLLLLASVLVGISAMLPRQSLRG